MRFMVIDDSKVSAALFEQLLTEAGHEVRSVLDSREAAAQAAQWQPEVVLLDLMMPHVDGFALLATLRADATLREMRIIVVTSKPYDADRQRVMSLGADGFIPKTTPREALLARIEQIVQGRLRIRFWGVRGTLPVPGEHTLRYGGNTSCVSLEFPDERLFIFDAGSGIKTLANTLLAERPGKLRASLFISHPHWDHINALPFFTPLYIKSNEFEILGPAQQDRGVEDLISAQMDGVFFPVTISEFAAHMRYRDLGEGDCEVDGIAVSCLLLSHPGRCLGYRVDYGGRRIAYVTDNELYPESTEWHNPEYRQQLADFVRGCDVLITDTTYTEAEYQGKEHWGHSTVTEVVALADAAQVRTLCLFHHDPEQDDAAIDRKLEIAQRQLAERGSQTQVIAPAEGSELRL